MIRLWKLNGSPLAKVFNPLAEGSEIYLTELTKDFRQRLVNLAVRKNFSRVVFINPELTSNLTEAVGSLAAAFVSQIFIVSNENVLRPFDPGTSLNQPSGKGRSLFDPWPGERAELTVTDLSARLPQTTIFRTREHSLFDLIKDLTEQKGFQAQKDLIVTNFSMISVLVALKLLGFPYEIKTTEKNQGIDYEHWGEFRDQPNPLNELAVLVDNLAQDRMAQYTSADRRPALEPILKELLIN